MYLFYTDFSSQNIEPFFNISLSLSKNLQQSLDDYVAEQVLNGDNLYQTELYGPQVAKKSVRFLSLPPILMVQLKRFEFNYTTGKNEKIMHHFEYPNQIDFRKWQVMSEQNCQYELYAVLVHEGIKAQSGHYYAFVKIQDEWYRFNDQEVCIASKLQVFDYNFGGQIDVVEFDVRQFKVFNRKTVSSSTAYMLVYVKKQLKEKLLNSEPIYPEWLKTHQITKQEEREQIRIRKNFYHDIQALDWEQNFKDTVADFLGIIPKDAEDFGEKVIDRLGKNDKVEQWVKPYNEKGVGVYVYLTTPQKIQYQTLINCQHRKSTFQQLIRDPSSQIFILYLPIITRIQSFLYVIKLVSATIKFGDQGEHEYKRNIKFHGLLEMNRNSRNTQLLTKLKQIYAEPGYVNRYFYEEKRQLLQIKEQNCLIKGPLIQRNILGIIIVQKIQAERAAEFKDCTIKWYNDLKNFVQIFIKSEDGKYEFKVQMDQNKPVQSLREYIFEQKLKEEESCSSSDNIVLKAKPKKTAKNYVQVTGAKTIRDLLKNCDKQNIIVFGFSNLKADERINQIEVKFMYRFSDFTFSEVFHVVLDRKSQNQSFNIYQKISEHEEVQKYRKAEKSEGIRIFLFSKDRSVINDIVLQNGYIHGKGEIAQVLQKQKGSNLVVESFKTVKIQQKMCPILLHHRSQSDEKIGTPRYLQFERSTKLTEIYQEILQLISEQVYDWEQKKVKVNPMKVTVYAYAKDYNKGTYLADQQTLMQFQIEEEQKNQVSKCEDKNGDSDNVEAIKQIIIDQEDKTETKKPQDGIVGIEQMASDKTKNGSQALTEQNKTEKQNLVPRSSSQENQKQVTHKRKNSKCEPKLKSWNKTIESAFPKAKFVKVVIHHLYLTKAQTAMKINVQ